MMVTVRTSRRWIMGLTVLGLWAPGLAAQGPQPRDTLLAAAREIIASARYCGLVTMGDQGQPHTRTMDPFAPDQDWSIWMGTNRNTRKVQEIERDPRVTLYYFSPELVGYVSVSGSARLVDDPAEKGKRWKAGWEGLYRNRGAEYLLIQVVPDRLEVVHYSRGIVGNPETWQPPSVVFPGRPPPSR